VPGAFAAQRPLSFWERSWGFPITLRGRDFSGRSSSQRRPCASESGEHTRPGVIVRRLRRTNLWRRGWDIGHRDLDEDNVRRLDLPLRQPTLVPGADAGHYTRGRCVPRTLAFQRAFRKPSERCSREPFRSSRSGRRPIEPRGKEIASAKPS